MSSATLAAGSQAGSNKLVYFFGAPGGLLFGYDTGVISGAILFITEDMGITPFLEALWSARFCSGQRSEPAAQVPSPIGWGDASRCSSRGSSGWSRA